MVLMMAGEELDPVFDPPAPVIALTHVGRLDAAGHQGKVRQDAARAAALDRRERSVECICCDPQTHAVDNPRA